MRQSRKSGGKKSRANVPMLPACSNKSPGFISAPRHDHTSNPANAAHASAPIKVRLDGCGKESAAAMAEIMVDAVTASAPGLPVEFRQLGVDFSELFLLLVGVKRRVAFDLDAVLEIFKLADRNQLRIARLAEPAVVIDVLQNGFFGRVGLAIVHDVVLDLRPDRGIQVLAPYQLVRR